jgi:hypothetical protein
MPCVPAPSLRRLSGPQADAFTFSTAPDAFGRTFENAATLWATPWMAFWAITLESLNPENYR